MSTLTTNPLNQLDLQRSLGAQRAETLVAIFKPLWERAGLAVTAASRITVTDATQVREIKAARDQRLVLRAIRLEADKHRKAEKESAQREAAAIQAIYNQIERIIEPEETRLEQCEKFAEIEDAKRRSRIKLTRQADLAYLDFTTPAGIVLEDLDDAEWGNLLTRAKHQKAEKDRLAEEAKKQAERDAAERERLRAEKADADQRAADAERQAREARMEADRVARAARLEREAAEAKAREEAEEAERVKRAAANAPDAEKLRAFRNRLDDLYVGEASTDAGKAVFEALERNIKRIRDWCTDKANSLEEGGA